MDIDPRTTFISSSLSPFTQSGNRIAWKYSNLLSLEQRKISVTLRMPDASHIGDTISTAVVIDSAINDADYENNSSVLYQIITDSSNPNDKTVNNSEDSLGYNHFSNVLNYTIRFQVQNDDTCYNVIVRDTLCSLLNPETLRLLSSSHDVSTILKGKNVVNFVFKNARIPNLEHGFVKFSVEPYSGIIKNVVLKNRGYIYFENKPPIQTNEVATTYVISGEKVLHISSNSLHLPSDANCSTTFNVVSNINWTASSNQSWLTLSSSSGSNNGTITVTAAANTSNTSRTATVTVSGQGVTDQTVTVTQAGQSVSPMLTVSPTTLNVNAAANSTASFTITSNVSWTASSNQSWLTLSSSSGSNNGTIEVTASANTSTSPRTATITVTGQGVTPQTVTVTQAGQSVSPTLTVSPTTLDVNAAANSTASFTITSNVSWTASSNQSWLTLNNSSGSNNGIIIVTASENIATSTRVATVTVSGGGVTDQTVTVTQAGQSVSPTLTVSPTTLDVNAAANSTASFTITSNVSWTANSNQSWLSLSSSSGSNNGTITVTASANTLNTSRTATVTVSGQGVTDQTVTVTQAGQSVSPTLTVSPTTLDVNAAANSTASFTITSNVSWTANSNQSWLTLSNYSGVNNATITVTAAANVGSNRTAIVTISGSGVVSQIVTVNQVREVSPYLTVSRNSLTIAAPANSIMRFNISSNVSWTAVSDQSWLSLSNSSGNSSITMTLMVAENASSQSRTASVAILGNGIAPEVVNVTQNGASPTLKISTNSLSFSAQASASFFDIISNISWTATSDQSWLTLSKSSGSGNSSVDLFLTENTSTSRTAVISVSGIGVTTRKISVTQAGGVASYLNVSTNALTIGNQANSMKSFSILSNINWNAVSNQSWLNLNYFNGFGDKLITMIAAENISTEKRTAIITITGLNVEQQTITIAQSGVPTDIDENENEGVLTYPNPVTDELTVQIPTSMQNVFVGIYTINGTKLYEAKISDDRLTLNMSGYTQGLYVLKIVAPDKVITKKIIKK